MEVIGAKIVEEDPIIGSGEKRIAPRTYFLLTAEEQKVYDDMRAEHDKLRQLPQGTTTEAQRTAVSDMFMKVVNSYLEKSGLTSNGSFTTFGKNGGRTFLRPPPYSLLKDEDGLVEPTFWFSTEDRNLSCLSYLTYRCERCYQNVVVHNIFDRIVKQQEQDGINFPFVMDTGSFIYFASSDFCLGLTMVIGDAINKIGSEKLEELCVLCGSYSEEAGKISDTFSDRTRKEAKIKSETFKTAYASSLEIALLEAGLV